MKTRKSGKRHTLLMYRRTMDRIWKLTLLLGIILTAIWGWGLFDETSILRFSSNTWLGAGAAVALVLSALFFLARFMAYVQPHGTCLSVVTPFLRMKISYRRVQSVHPVLMQQLFPREELRWSQRHYVESFYGKTAVVMELQGYPLSPTLLRLFLPAVMFSPRTAGFVFLVPDWMVFSTELDSFQGAWLQMQSGRVKSNGLAYKSRRTKSIWG